MCAPAIQGYGLTETCAASFIGVPDDVVRHLLTETHGSRGNCRSSAQTGTAGTVLIRLSLTRTCQPPLSVIGMVSLNEHPQGPTSVARHMARNASLFSRNPV